MRDGGGGRQRPGGGVHGGLVVELAPHVPVDLVLTVVLGDELQEVGAGRLGAEPAVGADPLEQRLRVRLRAPEPEVPAATGGPRVAAISATGGSEPGGELIDHRLDHVALELVDRRLGRPL